MPGRTSRVAFLLAVGGLLAGLAVTIPGIRLAAFYGTDAVCHVPWAIHFSSQLWGGEPYPRWLVGMNRGLGSPVFFFYTPVPYYLFSIFSPLWPDDDLYWLRFAVATSAIVAVAIASAYVWLRRHVDRTPAVVGALLYMAMPYVLTFDLYHRFGYAEVCAFIWLPLLMHYAEQIARGARGGVIGFAIVWALLIVTHLPTALLFSFVPFAYVAWTAPRGARVRAAVAIAVAAGLGVALTAVYLLPALLTQGNVSMAYMTDGRFSFDRNFIPPWPLQATEGVRGNILVTLVTSATLFAAAAAFAVSRRDPASGLRHEARFWIAIAVVAVLLMTWVGYPVWHLVGVIQKVQFPWRFNVVLVIAATALCAFAIQSLRGRAGAWLAVGVAVVVLIAANQLAYFMLWKPRVLHPSEGSATLLTDSLSTPEYRVRWVTRTDGPATRGPGARVLEGSGTVTIERWEPRRIDVDVTAESDVTIELARFYYPGWVAQSADSDASLVVHPTAEDGLLAVPAPRGHHRIALTLEPGREERLGGLVSAGAVVLLPLVALALRRSPRRRAAGMPTRG